MITRFYALFFCLVIFVMPAVAAPQVDWDQTISIELKDADLLATLQSFATIGGGAVIADPEVSGSVTIQSENLPWSTVLDGICKVHDLACYWLPGSPPSLRVGPSDVGFSGLAESISLELSGADLAEVLAAFRAISAEELDIADDIEGRVSFKLNSVPWPVAADHICSVGGCAIDWTAVPPRITGAPDRRVDEKALEVSMRTEAALERLARSPALGPMAPLELAIEGDLPAYLDAPIEGGAWASSLDALCQDLDCTWRLIYGEPSILELRARDARLEQKMPFADGQSFTAQDLGSRLATAAGVRFEKAEGITLEHEVHTNIDQPSWQIMADRLCGDARCSWRLTDEAFKLLPNSRPLAQAPTRRSAPVEISVRIQKAADEGDGTDRSNKVRAMTTSFSWARPVSDLALDAETALHLAWIPFDEPILLPLLADCRNGSVEALEPVSLPIEESESLRVGEHLVELSPSAEDAKASSAKPAAPAKPNPAPAGCVESGRVIVKLHELGKTSSRTQLQLGDGVGDYLLITPPAGGARPAAAVIRLDTEDDAPRVAVLRPRGDATPDIEISRLVGEPWVAEISHGERRFRLEVSAAP